MELRSYRGFIFEPKSESRSSQLSVSEGSDAVTGKDRNNKDGQ